ncbi:MAG TPA: hypothetical protein VHB79_32635 [Polyangiaceae bacterium]|nr:hypothetical protein [Polyangiaceae bacterium]
MGSSLGCGEELSGTVPAGELAGGGGGGLSAAPPFSEASDGGAAGSPLAEEGAAGAGDEMQELNQRRYELADFARCSDAKLSGLSAACDVASMPAVAVESTGGLQVNTLSVVELRSGPAGNSAALTVTPGQTGVYTLYLGTPNVGIAISSAGRAILPICARYVSEELASQLTDAPCPGLVGLYQLTLHGGSTYRFDFGPIAPERWVRAYLQADFRTDF